MGARQSAETQHAIRVFLAGKGKITMAKAAEKAGIFPSTLHRALKALGKLPVALRKQ